MSPSSPHEVALLIPLVVALLTTLTTIAVHAVALGAIVLFVRLEYKFRHAGVGFWRDVAIVGGVTLLILIAHVVEIAIWAALFNVCGEFTEFAPAFYHSAVNYTSLGYGDVVMSASWKLLGPLETANGMLMFGISTATMFFVIQRLFQTRSEAEASARTSH
jgi:hypothetical protein